MQKTNKSTSTTPSLFTRLAGMLLAAVLAASALSGCGYNEIGRAHV